MPEEAWNHQGFEYLSGGRTSMGVRIETDDIDLWAIRTDDPDKEIPGRVWTTEITVGHRRDQTVQLSLRLLVGTPEERPDIEPETPGCIRQIADKCTLLVDGFDLGSGPWAVGSDSDAGRLIDFLETRDRVLPVIVASGKEGSDDPSRPLIDTATLARATLGLVHVVVLPAPHTYALTDYFGKMRSVFLGAVRAYMPGFGPDAYPYDHRLYLANSLSTNEGRIQCSRSLRLLAASESLKRTRLGRDVVPFAMVRNAGLGLHQDKKIKSNKNEEKQLESAKKQIAELERQLQSARENETMLYDFVEEAEQRAEEAEQRERGSTLRIQRLTTQVRQRGRDPDEGIRLPGTWKEFADWCDENLAGRLVLASRARAGVKKPKFTGVETAARCLLWLANDGRDRCMGEGPGNLQDAPVLEGFRNAHCGNDAFGFQFQGQRLTADWHVKTGGNTRDPRRCLRIYYTWDRNNQQIIVADMPAHRRTGAA